MGGTRAVDWRNEYDPKQYRHHSSSQTVGDVERRKKSKKGRKSRNELESVSSVSATQFMEMAHEERWGGFGLGSSGDDPDKEDHSKLEPKHRGKQNGSIF